MRDPIHRLFSIRAARLEARIERRNPRAFFGAHMGREPFRSVEQACSWQDMSMPDREAMAVVEGGICFRDPHARRLEVRP